MSASFHGEAKARFLELASMVPAERSRALSALGFENPTLAAEVDRLLVAAEASASSFVDRPPGSLHALPKPGEPLGEIRGERTYQVLRELGRGGMAVVYLAVRVDGGLGQRVALKVLSKSGIEVLQRFHTERRILASLDHPAIARWLDAGNLPDGSPFLVMEYVDGRHVDRYCAENRLPLAERLRLFVAISEAVAAAHRMLVVHRDLKPANVLVDRHGQPKLLDFGIAKLLDPDDAGWTVVETRADAQPLTPRYASPEQVRGEPVSTATDVYALGVLLYELLTGCWPYPEELATPHRLGEAICRFEPLAPSVAAARARIETGEVGRSRGVRRIPRDLDAIVLKALRKDPAERYASVDALAADLRNLEAGRTVLARKGDLAYRAGKLVRRHRLGLGIGALVATLLAGWAASLALQLERTRAERDKAERVSSFLVDVFKRADPDQSRGGTVTAREILDQGAAKLAADPGVDPQVRAQLLDTIGTVGHSLGLFDQAEAQLRQALELRRAAAAADPLALAETLGHLGILLKDRERSAEAEPLLAEHLELVRREVPADDVRLLVALNRFATLLWDLGRFDEAETLTREVLALHLRRLGIPSLPWDPGEAPLVDEHWDLAFVLHNLGNQAYRRRDLELALSRFEQSLALKRTLAGPVHSTIATTLAAIGNCWNARGDSERALEYQRQALAMRVELLGAEHPTTAMSTLNVANELQLLGRVSEAIPHYEAALASTRAAFGERSAGAALVEVNLAQAYAALGRSAEALAAAEHALSIRLELFAPGHENVAYARGALAECLRLAGRPADALRERENAVLLFERAYGADHEETLDARLGRARDLTALGRCREAEQELREVVARLDRAAAQPVLAADGWFTLAEVLALDPTRAGEAATAAREAEERLRSLPAQGRVSPERIAALRSRLSSPPTGLSAR